MASLINDKIHNQLNLIVKKLFEGNRLLDRQMTQLEVKFVMNKTSGILHTGLAHKYPLLADKISEYMASRNCQTVYLKMFYKYLSHI